MKKAFIILCLAAGVMAHREALGGCPTCGGFSSAQSAGNDAGPNFSFSMGGAGYGESAGYLKFSGSAPSATLFTPIALQFDETNTPGVVLVTTNVITTSFETDVVTEAVLVTNMLSGTNIITTAAGNGTQGYSGDGGYPTNAELYSPAGIAIAAGAANNCYIADTGNNRVRLLVGCVIYTTAGNGTAGYSGDGGAATSAELNGPTGVAVDSSGDVYIADKGNNVIRKVDTSGNITTVAGDGTAGYSGDGGAATSAELNGPTAVAVDASGNLYIADTGNNVIRMVDTGGNITTMAGDGTAGYSGDGGAATSAELSGPYGVALDAAGNLYVADTGNNRVRMVDTSGNITTVAGDGTAGYSGDGGAATSAELSGPYGVALDSFGNLYIADTGNSILRQVIGGVINTIAGQTDQSSFDGGDGGPAEYSGLNAPAGLTVDAFGNLFIADINNSDVREIEASGAYFCAVTETTTNVTVTTNVVVRQIIAPQAVADVPPQPTANGYVINFYYPSQMGAQNPDGTYQLSGTPFITWLVTNPAPSSIDQLQVFEYGNVPDYGLMKGWTYTYSTNSGAWAAVSMAGVQKNSSIITLTTNSWQVLDTVQYSNGPVVAQTRTTYTNFTWGGVAPVRVAIGSDSDPEVTTYTYWDPSTFGAGTLVLPELVTHPDGSWNYYAGYDANGNPTNVYSSFEDVSSGNYTSGRETVYSYDTNTVSGSGDNGILDPNAPRETIEYIAGNEVARSYAAFPSVGERLDIQCTAPGAAWSDSHNLITTNLFYTSGPNQFALEAVINPDGTMSTYDYFTNSTGGYETNITVTGQPDSTYTYVVDGVSNVVVLNSAGYDVSSASYDVRTGLALSDDVYGNFDSFGRPQQVTHLDGTTEDTYYACCGLDSTINADGVETQYLYDQDKRQIGYEKVYNHVPITYSNWLDAVGRTVAGVRVGSDNSRITMGGSEYDSAGEMIAQTNALGGVTTYTRSNDPNTGGLTRTTTDPDGGTVTDYYYDDGSLKESVGTAVHGKAYAYGYGTDANGDTCTWTEETNLNADGSLSSEWTETFSDAAGRTTEILYADGHYSQSFYNAQGQLSRQVDPDGVTTLYQYDAKGELAYTAVDMDRNGTIDFSGTDRITETTNDVTTDHGTTVRRARTYEWLDGQSTGTLVSQSETSADGLNTWQTQYRDANTPATGHDQTAYSSPSRTVTVTAPDGSYTVNAYSYGRLVSSTRYDSAHGQIGGTSYAYDAHGRQYQATDARNGTTTYGYNNADLVTSVTTPAPGNGQSAETTTTYYNASLQATDVVQPDGTSVNSVYLPTGELGLQYGSRTYPVAYSYDYAGRMKAMTNSSDFAGTSFGTGARVTTWNYDAERGFLTGKSYPDGTGPSYTYTAAGRLLTRAWARMVGGLALSTTYGYDNGGDLQSVAYSDGATPNVAYTYDRLGRRSTVSWNGITDTLTYNLANEMLGESYSGGILNGFSVTNGYDADLRRFNVTALSGGSALQSTAYGYDNASRLSTVSDGNNDSATYSYVANSPLAGQITFAQSGATRMTMGKTYDDLNRLTDISNAPSSGAAATFNYGYNAANQRTKDTLADGSYWVYGYDSLGQVTSGKKYWRDGTPVAGQQFDYAFDTIGNRTQTKTGGDQTGANQRTANYTDNNLNQITSRDVPGYADIIGASIATNVVTVNGNTAYRKWEYFREELPVDNSAGALWTNITVSGTGQGTVSGHLYVPQTPQPFQYDLDGNLTNDGRFAYTWDTENRLIDMTSLATDPDGSKVKLDFAYDAQGRRIGKIVSTWNGSAYVPVSTNLFLYDGWNLVAELNPDGSVIRSYVWGDDLSGSQQGAGGIGGLLEVSYHGTQTTNCFVAFDGNGNVAALVNAADGTVAANYEYGPFGEVIRSTGPMAKANPIRWSTKYQDDESDLIMYPYRPYKPSTGTWLSQDPKMEPGFELVFRHNSRSSPNDFIDDYGNFNKGDLNAYAFVKNGPLQYSDPLGLDSEPDVSWAPAPCPFGEKSIFIQTLYGGWGPYKGPRVDDGGAGFFGGGSKGCPDYPSFGMPGVFQDSPSGVLTGPVHFITCRVCLKKCGCDEWRIASIGPCIYWKKGDKGDLSGSGFTQVSGPPQTWEDALDQDYPTVAHGLCYKCLGNK